MELTIQLAVIMIGKQAINNLVEVRSFFLIEKRCSKKYAVLFSFTQA